MINREHKIGMEVKFVGCSKEQIKWGGNDDPKGLLKNGNKYTVTHIEGHRWHTKLSLKGIKGKFNSVCFD